MSIIEDIKAAILALDSGPFQNLCDDYLNDCGYSNIVSLGSKPGTTKTTAGTPDTYLCHDKNGNYIFIEYTTQQTSIYSKISSDITKCLDESFTHINCEKISEIWYFHTTSNLTPEQDAELKERCKAKGILLKMYGIDYFANELYNKHKYLVKQHLGISIATEQILSHSDFVHIYNQAKTAAPIDTEFKFRSEEINSILCALEDNKAVLLCGVAGVGKTRLALECCQRYAEKNEYQFFCIRNNNQPIYDDLHLFFRLSGNYIILIDDANELTQLETILNFFIEHTDSNYKIILSVRNYAAKEVSTTVKSILDLSVLNLKQLKDNEIEELLKDSYGIKNHLFLKRIVKIAEGNARIALLAGKIAVESKSLDSINDVASLYDSYYGRHLTKLGLSDGLLLVAGIAAFVGAIHLDRLDLLKDVISLSGLSNESFRESLYELHRTEIINIYKNKAVKFADQCLSNYLLYHVFMDKKLIRLSDIIRNTFKTNKSQTINSINVLTQLYSTSNSQVYLFSEIRQLWLILEKEDPLFFWEYVKVFYLVNPTDSLLLTKRKIENAEKVITSIDEVAVNEQNTTVSDDILTILGGFANREELDAALDLYFLYYQKRPDLLQQFYNTAITEYGITLDDQKYDYNTLNRLIQKFIENAENWKNKNVCRLFVYSAKHFLQFSFHSVGNKGKNGVMFYTIEIRATNGTAEYRKKIWENLISMYSQGIEMKQIESILYNYGNGSSKDSEEIVKKDYPYIIELLKLFTNKGSYFFCRICDNLKRIFTLMDTPQDEEFNSLLESNPFQLFKAFDRITDHELTFFEKEEITKREIEQYISGLNKEEFIEIIDYFCDAEIEIGYFIIQSINYAFEYIFENKDYYLDALEHYFNYEHKQFPLNPDKQIALMYSKYTDEEIWSIISEAPPEIKNTWQFYFFANMTQKYIDYNHLQKWYEYLNDDSDKSIQSSGYRNLFFLSQYKSIDPDVIRKSLQTVLAKQEYSVFIVQIYTTLFSNSLTEMISATMDFFTDSYDLLSELYVLSVTTKRHEDYHGELLKEIYVRYPSVLDLLIEHWNTNDSYLSHDDTLRLSKLFEVENYEELFDHIMDMTAQSHRSYELSSMLSSANINEKYKDRPDKWLNYFIVKNANDDRKMQMISEAISGMSEDKKIEYLKLFLSKNKDIEAFKNWYLFPIVLSCTGSELPLFQKQIDFLIRVLSLLNGLAFLEHKKYIEDEIDAKKRHMEDVEIEEILSGLEQ